MGRRLLGSLASATIATLLLAGVADASKWVGRATNLKGDFNYGKVTFTVKGGFIRNLKIEAVTTKSSTIPFTTVVVPKAKIRGNTFSARHVPVPGIEDVIKVSGTIKGSIAKGRFQEGPLIPCEGKFTARKR